MKRLHFRCEHGEVCIVALDDCGAVVDLHWLGIAEAVDMVCELRAAINHAIRDVTTIEWTRQQFTDPGTLPIPITPYRTEPIISLAPRVPHE